MRSANALMAAAAALLSACGSLPRGAGLQSEVLSRAAVAAEADQPAGFAVEPVTRATIARLAEWPAVGEPALRWIERTDQPDSRIIRPGDTLTITIWNTEEFGLLTAPGQRFVTLQPMQVSASGTVFLPYIGEVSVRGLAPETARVRIEERYLEVTPSAQVQLALEEGRQSTVSLVSGVASAGVYPLPDQDFTILELIAAGGGVSAALENPQVRLQRGGELFGVSLARLLSEPALDTTLMPGDRVIIEEEERSFLSLGAAGREALHRFPKDRVTALEALAIIGGVAEDRADAQGILILRRYPERAVRADGSGPSHARTVFTIDLTSADGLFSAGQFLIRPGDLVYVTESPLIGARNILQLIGTTFGLVNQISR